MSRYVTVRVTQEDITRGRRMNGSACPVAMAVQRSGYPDAHVGSTHWWPDGQFRDAAHPGFRVSGPAARFIDVFDDGKPVQPATFRLPLP